MVVTIRVSVIMPMRNAEAFVQDALASVLAERAIALEVVVIDDGSTDDSRARALAVGDPRVRLLDGPRQGISAALNLGLEQARGEILMRCDADDLYPPDRIARQVAWLDAHPGHGAICGAFSTMDMAGRPLARLGVSDREEPEDIDAELRQGVTRTSLCTFAIRRDHAERVGGFRGYFETSEDIDYLLRLGEHGRVAYIPHNTYHYRLHQSSVTHSQANTRRAFFEDMARQFQAQRLRDGADALQRGEPPAPPPATDVHHQSATRHVQGMLLGQAWREAGQGRRMQAVRLAARAVAHGPGLFAAWRALAVLVIQGVLRFGR